MFYILIYGLIGFLFYIGSFIGRHEKGKSIDLFGEEITTLVGCVLFWPVVIGYVLTRAFKDNDDA